MTVSDDPAVTVILIRHGGTWQTLAAIYLALGLAVAILLTTSMLWRQKLLDA